MQDANETCASGKVAYLTWRAAWRVAVQARRRKERLLLRPYPCRLCVSLA
jgi:hypothetical protein